MELTQRHLKSIVHYCPHTGDITQKKRTSQRVKVGDVIGSITTQGYKRVCIGGVRYLAHRLAWLYMTGAFPDDQIDHVDQNRSNNVWGNLREVSNQGNCKNRTQQTNNTSGKTGVYLTANGSWMAAVGINGRATYIGVYKEWWDAVCARMSAERVHGFSANHGRQV